eukprot:1161078-Pelagomonas_calceolata.AAC.20
MASHYMRWLGDDSSCLTLLGTRAVTCTVPGRDPRTFAFDNVLFGPQTEVFEGEEQLILVCLISLAWHGRSIQLHVGQAETSPAP